MSQIFFSVSNSNVKKSSSAFLKVFFWVGFWGIVSFVSFYTLFNANWILGDDVIFFSRSALGLYSPLDFGTGGRFFPLGKYDFNLLLLFEAGQTPFAHYFWITITVIISLFLFAQILRKIGDEVPSFWSPIIALFFLFLFVTAPYFVEVVIDLIFPERILLFCLSLFMWFYYRALKTNQAVSYGIAFLAAVYATYCKEPVFFVFLSVGLIPLVFQRRELSKNQKIFYSSLIVNAVVFLLLYYVFVYQNVTHFYNSGRYSGSLWDITMLAFKDQRLLIPIFLLGLGRAFFVLFKPQKILVFFDGLLFGGIGYALIMIILKLPTPYYFIPALFLCLPVLYFWLLKLYQKTKIGTLIGLIILGSLSFNSVTQMQILIEQNQKKRQEDMVFLDKFFEEIKAGKKSIFYSFEFEDGSFNNQMIEFKKSVVWRAILYKMRIGLSKEADAALVLDAQNNPEKILLTTNKLSELKGKEYVLFAPELVNDYTKYQELLKELNTNAYELKDGPYFILQYHPASAEEIPFNTAILFSDANMKVRSSGLSVTEPWGRWSNGKGVYLFFKVNTSQKIKVNFDIKMPLPLDEYPQEVAVFANDVFLEKINFDANQQEPKMSFVIPSSVIPQTGVVRLRFEIKNPRSLKELGLSEDTRELGIGFVQMIVTSEDMKK